MRRTGSACIARYRYRRTRWSDAAAGANSAPRLTAPARPRISLIVFRAVTPVGACLQDRPLRRAAPVINDFARVSPRAGRLFRYLRIPDHAPDRQPTASRRRISVRAAFSEFYHLCCSLQLSRLEARELADSTRHRGNGVELLLYGRYRVFFTQVGNPSAAAYLVAGCRDAIVNSPILKPRKPKQSRARICDERPRPDGL